MDGELLSLKWNNHRTTFYHVISGLRNKESYTDVTLACDGKFYPVHKLVLSTCSEYFSDIFERTNCKNPVVILKDIQCSDLEFLLDYMYIGEVNVRQNELSSLIKAAECLRVKGLAVPDEEPKKSSSSSSRQRPEQQSPPSKRRRTEERRNTDHSPGRPPDTRRGSSSSVNSENRDINPARDVNPSQRSDDPPSRRDRNSSSDQNAGTPVQQIKLEKDEDDQEIYTIQSNSFDGGGDGPDTEGDSATEFPEFLQSSIEKEEPMPMSDYNPGEFPGPSGVQNSGVPPWDGDSSGFTESISGAVAAAVAAAQQPGQQQQQQQQLLSAEAAAATCVDGGVTLWPMVEGGSGAYYGEEEGKESLSCPICGRLSSRRDHLRRHMRIHTGEKPHKCPHCDFRSLLKWNIKSHIMRKHSNHAAQTQQIDHSSPPSTFWQHQ